MGQPRSWIGREDRLGTLSSRSIFMQVQLKLCQTRMHSSRMCTAHALTIGCGGGVCGVGGSRRYLLGGYLPGGTCPGGCTCPEGCTCPGTHPPSVNRMTDRCKNITLPKTSFAGGNNRSAHPFWGNPGSATELVVF